MLKGQLEYGMCYWKKLFHSWWTFRQSGLSSSQLQGARLNYPLKMRPIPYQIHLCVPSTRHSAWYIVGAQDIFVTWINEGMAHIDFWDFLKYPSPLCVITGRWTTKSCPLHMCLCHAWVWALSISAIPTILEQLYIALPLEFIHFEFDWFDDINYLIRCQEAWREG